MPPLRLCCSQFQRDSGKAGLSENEFADFPAEAVTKVLFCRRVLFSRCCQRQIHSALTQKTQHSTFLSKPSSSFCLYRIGSVLHYMLLNFSFRCILLFSYLRRINFEWKSLCSAGGNSQDLNHLLWCPAFESYEELSLALLSLY